MKSILIRSVFGLILAVTFATAATAQTPELDKAAKIAACVLDEGKINPENKECSYTRYLYRKCAISESLYKDYRLVQENIYHLKELVWTNYSVTPWGVDQPTVEIFAKSAPTQINDFSYIINISGLTPAEMTKLGSTINSPVLTCENNPVLN